MWLKNVNILMETHLWYNFKQSPPSLYVHSLNLPQLIKDKCLYVYGSIFIRKSKTDFTETTWGKLQ